MAIATQGLYKLLVRCRRLILTQSIGKQSKTKVIQEKYIVKTPYSKRQYQHDIKSIEEGQYENEARNFLVNLQRY